MEELSFIEKYLPTAVIVAVFIVILLVKVTCTIVETIEEIVEEKKGKQIRIFDHKKIFVNLFYCLFMSVALCVAGFITWKEAPFYCFVIMGCSTFFYEAILKRLEK